MKYYILFIVLNLAIIFAYADFNGKGKINVENMKKHMEKIRGLLRNLDTSDDENDDDDSSDEDSSGNEEDNSPKNITSTLPETRKPNTGNKFSLVQLINFNSFKAPPMEPRITFNTFFYCYI